MNTRNQLNNMGITPEKLEEIVKIVNSYMEATEEEISDYIIGGESGWDEGEDHSAWCKSATAEEISNWYISGNQ